MQGAASHRLKMSLYRCVPARSHICTPSGELHEDDDAPDADVGLITLCAVWHKPRLGVAIVDDMRGSLTLYGTQDDETFGSLQLLKTQIKPHLILTTPAKNEADLAFIDA